MAIKRFRLPEPVRGARAEEIRSSLLTLPGVDDVTLDDGSDLVSADVDAEVVSDDELLAAIGRAGVEASLA